MGAIALQGRVVRLRAVEPDDVETMYRWENDPEVWRVSGTLAPFSRHALMQFVEEQRYDLYRTRQLRLIIENPEGKAVGTLDLFEFWSTTPRSGAGDMRRMHSKRSGDMPARYWGCTSSGATSVPTTRRASDSSTAPDSSARAANAIGPSLRRASGTN